MTYLGTIPHRRPTPARLHYATRDRKLAPVGLEDYRGPGNRKKRPVPLGPYCSATYVSIEATCPSSCRFRGDGCYVTEGFTARANRILDADAAALGLDGDGAIEAEARLVELSFSGPSGRGGPSRGGPVPRDGGRDGRSGRDLRLHVGGDVSGTWGAMRLGVAARSWLRRGGGAVWTYTHRWRSVLRAAWGPISVLASVETTAEASRASLLRYVPAIVLRSFPSERAFRLPGSPLSWIPCPAETRGTTCVRCRLCLDAEALRRRGLGIAFAVHGGHGDRVRLPVIG